MKKISIIIPTLNAQRTLEECLKHIRQQSISEKKYEIIIADGGSTDQTIKIAKQYQAKIIHNKHKTGEAGKMEGVKKAEGELIAFIDSDNIIIDKNWLEKMTKPFEDQDIIATEPIRYECRKTDNAMTRYFAYMGMGDPLNYFLGNYDRICAINNKWTALKVQQEKREGYLKIKLNTNEPLPTIGANGFIIRKSILEPLINNDYLFDVDMVRHLECVYMAKVDVGIVHVFAPNIATFIRKQQRRARDYLYYNKKNQRKHASNNEKSLINVLYPGGVNLLGLLYFIFACLTFIPLIMQTLRGFAQKRDGVWIMHPLICWITLIVYATERIKSLYKIEIYNRESWVQ